MAQKLNEIKFVKPLSVAKIAAVIFPLCGLMMLSVWYLGYQLMFSAGSSVTSSQTTDSSSMTSVSSSPNAITSLVVLVLFSISGYFVGYIGALVYNIVAKHIGGIEIKMS